MTQVLSRLFGAFLLGFSQWLMAAEGINASASVVRMLIGLAIVLLVLAAITWVMKKTMRGKLGQNNAIKIIDGVSVGTRERVMVVEVADRWLVVGVAAGQVTSLANLPANTSAKAEHTQNDDAKTNQAFSSLLANAAKQQDKS